MHVVIMPALRNCLCAQIMQFYWILLFFYLTWSNKFKRLKICLIGKKIFLHRFKYLIQWEFENWISAKIWIGKYLGLLMYLDILFFFLLIHVSVIFSLKTFIILFVYIWCGLLNINLYIFLKMISDSNNFVNDCIGLIFSCGFILMLLAYFTESAISKYRQ